MTYREIKQNPPIIPPRCSTHQVIKGLLVDPDDESRRCICCEHYTKSLDCKRCTECMKTDNLINFEADHFIKDEPWYMILMRKGCPQPIKVEMEGEKQIRVFWKEVK